VQAIEAHARDAQLAHIAGGTDLLGLIKDWVTLPERLLDINDLPGVAAIEGLGKLAAVPVVPAIANAVFHATGKRVRDLPVTIDQLL
jgi:hypothetical protein